MLCTSCGHVGVADTWIPGSERAELAAWCCLGLPGLVYCAWRHLLRIKHCPGCGGRELIREARASSRGLGDARRIARVHSDGVSPWPLALRTPRERLRRGAALAAFGLLAAIAAVDGSLTDTSTGHEAIGHASALFSMSWVFVQIALFHRAPSPWRAWTENGRPIDVEVL